jgi:hypothetical protein
VEARRFSGARFASAPFAAHAAFPARQAFFHDRFHDRFFHHCFFHHRFFHHRFHRFAFVGVPFAFAAYDDGCWRRIWTRFGPEWVNVCGDYY